MRTLAQLSYDVARIVLPDQIVTGSATAGTTTTLTDTNNLIQADGKFLRGTLWIRSGTYDGSVAIVTGNVNNKLTFAALAGAIVSGVQYAVMTNAYPYQQIKSAINQAQHDTYVEAVDSSLTGDGEVLEFTLPAGVYDVKRVEIENPNDANDKYISNHWRIKEGKIKFDYGYPPPDDYVINVVSREYPTDLVDADDTVDEEINPRWLVHKAAEYLLLGYGIGKYGSQAEYRIEERMNMVLDKLKTLPKRVSMPSVTVRSGGY